MKVTRDVIVDLWPVYEAGDASADTRALVEEFLSADPELAVRLREGEETMSDLLFPRTTLLTPDVEKAAFDRMRELSRLRSSFFALSVALLMFSGMLRQYRWVSGLLAAGAGLVCLGLWLAETRPGLAALAVGPLVETRAQARFRRFRSIAILASFGCLAGAVFAGRAYGGPLLAMSGLALAGWVVLAITGRDRR
jgi:anti-sigma factor RsiW